MTIQLGAPLALYLSWGSSPFPHVDADAVRSAFGTEALEKVEKLLEEICDLEPDWSVHDLVSGANWAVAEMRRRHPQIDNESARLLGWAFSFWNK